MNPVVNQRDVSELDPAIEQVNQRLRQSGVRASILRRKRALFLRATLPPKPGDTERKRYELSLGVAATPAGLKFAEAKAKLLSGELDSNTFQWSNWLKPKEDRSPASTVSEWVTKFEENYFGERGRDRFTESTYSSEYAAVLRKLPQDVELTKEVLYQAIASTKGNTRSRLRYCISLAEFARFAGLKLEIDRLKGNYSPTQTEPRNIPSDDLIREWRDRIPNPDWQFLYGYLATYGLRPCEAFYVDWDSVRASKEGEILVTSAKTRRQELRRIYPLSPLWWEEWRLWEGTMPEIAAKTNRDYGCRVCHAFKRYKIPFTPYDLRHAYAIRAALVGVEVSIVSKWMGHSIAVHQRTYLNWMNERHHQLAFSQVKKLF